jgi:hypothetical protein
MVFFSVIPYPPQKQGLFLVFSSTYIEESIFIINNNIININIININNIIIYGEMNNLIIHLIY